MTVDGGVEGGILTTVMLALYYRPFLTNEALRVL